MSPWAAPGSAASGHAPFAGPSAAEPTAAGFPVTDLLAAGEAPAEGIVRRGARRPRPALLLSSALVLGVLAGGGIGYGIQSQRPPTPLPPIQVALPRYPAAVADPKAVADAAPKPLGIDGDLLKLVIARPEGTEAWGDNPDRPTWLTVGELAERSGASKSRFSTLNQQGFRRAAGIDWQKGGTKYRVTLVQFGPDSAGGAISEATDTANLPIVDGANGVYRVASVASTWADSTEKYYYGYAVARRGTLVMEIEIFAPQKADATELKDLAKKQWERLV